MAVALCNLNCWSILTWQEDRNSLAFSRNLRTHQAQYEFRPVFLEQRSCFTSWKLSSKSLAEWIQIRIHYFTAKENFAVWQEETDSMTRSKCLTDYNSALFAGTLRKKLKIRRFRSLSRQSRHHDVNKRLQEWWTERAATITSEALKRAPDVHHYVIGAH